MSVSRVTLKDETVGIPGLINDVVDITVTREKATTNSRERKTDSNA